MRRFVLTAWLFNALCPPAWAEERQAQTNALEAISVYAQGERADGPVAGYRASRSASATRTDTPLHETPQAITVVPQQVVEDTAATRLDEVLDYAGGVGRANNFGGQGLTAFTVRGFSSDAFYRNGFPINRGYPNGPDAYTVERLEVLRGPASTLYGRSDPGGTFNIVSKQPQRERNLTLGSQWNDEGLRRGTLDATGALDPGGKLRYRLNALAEGGDSFREHVHSERYGASPVLSWQPNDATQLVLEADVMRNNRPLDRGLTGYANQLGRGSRKTSLWETGSHSLDNDNNWAQLRFRHDISDDWTLGGGFQWLDGQLHGYAVEANGLQPDGRTLGRNLTHRDLDWADRDLQLNVTGRFQTGGVQHRLLTGLEYENYDYRSQLRRSAAGAEAYPIDLFDPVQGLPAPPLTRTTSHDHEALETWAAFIQDQAALPERLKVLAGLRIERFEQNYRDHLPGRSGWTAADNALTPRVGVIYDLTPALAVYANLARSYKPNTGADGQGDGFDPEEGKSYELGIKWNLLADTLSLDAAVYHIDKENVLTVDPDDSSQSVATGEVRSRGLDVNLVGDITPELRVTGGYAYVDALVKKDATLPAGTRLANIPRHAFNLLGVYQFRQGPAQGLGLGAGVRYVDRRAAQTLATHYEMDNYWLLDLLAFYQVNDRLRLNLNLRNLFNKNYDESAYNTYVAPGAPRSAQVGLTYSLW